MTLSGNMYEAVKKAGSDIEPRRWSELAYILGRHGYKAPEDVKVLKLSEAAQWYRVGEVSLKVLKRMGAVDDLPEKPPSRAERMRKLEALCIDLYTCHCFVMAGPDFSCGRDCPFLREGAYFDGDDGCAMPDVYGRMEELGILPPNERSGDEG